MATIRKASFRLSEELDIKLNSIKEYYKCSSDTGIFQKLIEEIYAEKVEPQINKEFILQLEQATDLINCNTTKELLKIFIEELEILRVVEVKSQEEIFTSFIKLFMGNVNIFIEEHIDNLYTEDDCLNRIEKVEKLGKLYSIAFDNIDRRVQREFKISVTDAMKKFAFAVFITMSIRLEGKEKALEYIQEVAKK